MAWRNDGNVARTVAISNGGGKSPVMQDEIQLSVASDPRLLSAVRGLVRGYMGGLGFSGDQQDALVLAIDEACSNSMRHAYQARRGEIVHLEFRRDDEWVEVEVSDSGIPASVESLQPRACTTPDPVSVKPGGLGVQLIHDVFDEVRFDVGKERGNRVTMRLRLAASAQ